MNTTMIETPTPPTEVAAPAIVAVKRRAIDAVLIGFGVLATVVLAIVGGLLTWGNNFAGDYVHDELASQNVAFPPADALSDEGRTDLLKYAGNTVDTGKEAEAYASYINGHLAGIADGKTYADLGGPERAAKAEVQAAIDSGADQAKIDELKATAAGLTGQRDSLFRGETLRGLLLTAFAWSTIGTIAGIAAVVAFAAAGLMLCLVVLGIIHHAKTPKTA